MTFKEYQKEEYCWLLYHSVLLNMALHKQIPFRAVQYDVDKNNQCILLFKEANGIVTTRKMTCTKADMAFVRAWLASDFPKLEFQIVESQEDIEGCCWNV